MQFAELETAFGFDVDRAGLSVSFASEYAIPQPADPFF